MTKVCRKCGIEKNFDEFGKDSGNSSGRRAACKSCRNQQYREQRALGAKPRSPSAFVRDGKKACSKCKRVMPVSQFWTHRKAECGFYPSCKDCNKTERNAEKKQGDAAPVVQKRRRFPPFKGYGFPERRERVYP